MSAIRRFVPAAAVALLALSACKSNKCCGRQGNDRHEWTTSRTRHNAQGHPEQKDAAGHPQMALIPGAQPSELPRYPAEIHTVNIDEPAGVVRQRRVTTGQDPAEGPAI